MKNQLGQWTSPYVTNHRFFDVIDTEEKAYWLGFIMGDGDINKQRNRLSITLQGKDRKHLEKFVRSLKTNYLVYDYTNSSSGVRITSKQIVASLKDLGVTSNKTFTVKPCTQVPEHLLRHYWRGLVDADGCISKSKRKNRNSLIWRINFCGNIYMVQGFEKYIKQFINTKAIPNKIRNVYQITFGGLRLSQEILNLLYGNSEIYLDRKKRLSDEFLREIPKRHWGRN